MTDLSQFNPTSLDALLDAMLTEGRSAVEGVLDDAITARAHLKTLADASLKTMKALGEGTISAETAAETMEERKAVLGQMLEFELFLAHVAAQKLTDAIFRVIGWAIFNRTGINLVPGLVQPA
ncbi:hypothetical protein [Sphingosinicella sp. LY1275]|uniref:hypothetical protein n=1 Tax=Sphingosinicella sp. LY1275 TaxID=3095379 RepID=UPI002ADEC2DE|nr:hypothetical protein [Sphingosinicella sp. LY1275]MEA1014117.1 hypothetical protein [Sphingosinicella sp. LY1275]